MARKKGICLLCGKGGPLSFEHVPPEGGGNIRGVVMHTFEDWMERESLDGPLPNGIPQPEGMGIFALCTSCNSFLGQEYVPAHIRLVRGGEYLLNQLPTPVAELDALLVTTVLSIHLDKIDRLACVKQLVAMILVTSGRDIAKAHPALVEFVLNPRALSLPAQYRAFLALVPGPAARTTGFFMRGGAVDAPYVAAAEVVYPPFSYVLAFNGAAVWPVGEITTWASAPFGESAPIDLDLPLGFTHTAFPCDIRTRAQVEATRRENLAAGAPDDAA